MELGKGELFASHRISFCFLLNVIPHAMVIDVKTQPKVNKESLSEVCKFQHYHNKVSGMRQKRLPVSLGPFGGRECLCY